MTLSSRLLVSCAALALLPAAPALAADYDPPIFVEQAPEWVPVEIGSGWYLRGDVSYTFDRKFRDTALRLDNTVFDTALVRFDPAVLPLDVYSLSEKGTPVSGSVGFGYRINDFLRAEANIGLLYNTKYTGSGFLGERFSFIDPTTEFGCLGHRNTNVTATTVTTVQGVDADGNPTTTETTSVQTFAGGGEAREGCGVNASVNASAWSGTLNAYADLGTFAGFTPYIGAGAGLVYTRSKVNVDATCLPETTGNVTTNGGGTSSVTTIATDHAFLCRGENGLTATPVTYNPVSARHADYNFLYSLSAGFAYQLTENTLLDVGYQYIDAPSLKGFDQHQVKVGLRYELW